MPKVISFCMCSLQPQVLKSPVKVVIIILFDVSLANTPLSQLNLKPKAVFPHSTLRLMHAEHILKTLRRLTGDEVTGRRDAYPQIQQIRTDDGIYNDCNVSSVKSINMNGFLFQNAKNARIFSLP